MRIRTYYWAQTLILTLFFLPLLSNVAGDAAVVRKGIPQSAQELQYLQKRDKKVHLALEAMLQRPLDEHAVPRIAILGSGGGYRAMLCTCGSLVGAEKIGLLDATTYIAGVSGSCWAIGTWMLSDLPISAFRDSLVQRASSGKLYSVTFTELKNIFKTMLGAKKLTTVGLYGTMLGNKLLSGSLAQKQQYTLSDQKKYIEDAQRPFPLYTAVQAHGDTYGWYAFTPYEVGLISKGYYVPAHLFGSTVENGRLKKEKPELLFSYLMGIFGSAFSGKIGVMYERKIKAAVSKYRVRSVIIRAFMSMLKNRQPFSAKVRNIMSHVSFDPLARFKHVGLMDAGFSLNIPLPLFMGPAESVRPVDIIIVLDSAKLAHEADGLSKLVHYAKTHDILLPPIDIKAAQNKVITVFKDEHNVDLPVIIYMPSLVDNACSEENLEKLFDEYKPYVDHFSLREAASSGYAKTFNFKYAPVQAKQLTMLTESNMMASKSTICDAFNWVIDHKLSVQRESHG